VLLFIEDFSINSTIMASLERTQRRKQVLFPQKLWEILEDPRWAEWISWHDNGRSVMIQSRQAFAENVMLVYWVSQQRKPSAESASSKPAWEKAWNSFDRQLRNYNFKKLDTVNMIVFAHVSLNITELDISLKFDQNLTFQS